MKNDCVIQKSPVYCDCNYLHTMASKEWIKNNAESLRKYRRDWYHRNKKKRRIQNNQSRKNRQRDLNAIILSFKKDCLLCPETHPACLDFHHRDPKQKRFCVASHQGNCSIDELLTEIAKCDVICSNCHRKLHWTEKMARTEEVASSQLDLESDSPLGNMGAYLESGAGDQIRTGAVSLATR